MTDVDAFTDFVRDNPQGLSGIDRKIAVKTIRRLAESGASARELFSRIINSIHASFLFRQVYDLLSENKQSRAALLDAVMTAPSRVWWDNILDQKMVPVMFSRAEDFEYLLKNRRKEFFDKEHCLYNAFPKDEYWKERVRSYIAKKDLFRAWTMLKKAERGFYVGNEGKDGDECRSKEEMHCYAATVNTVDSLADELYAAMLAQGILPCSIEQQAIEVWDKLDAYWRAYRRSLKARGNEEVNEEG